MAEAGKALELDGTYIPFSYIEQVSLVSLLQVLQLCHACHRKHLPSKHSFSQMASYDRHPCNNPQVQLEKLTEQFQTVTEDMRRRFAVDGEPMVNAGHVSASSPLAMAASPLRTASAGGAGFFRQTGFTPPQQSRPGVASSGVWFM